jgi:hypothetical protein
MDPQATWEQLLSAYAAGDWDAIEERATELIEHLDRGGTPPRVVNRLGLGPDWDRAQAYSGCLFALETVQAQWSTLPW